MYFPKEKTFVVSRDVRFDENDLNWNIPSEDQTSKEIQETIDLTFLFNDTNTNNSTDSDINRDQEPTISDNFNSIDYSLDTGDHTNLSDLTYYPVEKRTSDRAKRAPDRYSLETYLAFRTRYSLGIMEGDVPDGVRSGYGYKYGEGANKLSCRTRLHFLCFWKEVIVIERGGILLLSYHI